MDTLTVLDSLKDGAVHGGRFYPMNYELAVFDDVHKRQQAVHHLFAAGWETDEVLAVEGAELLEQHRLRDQRRAPVDRVISQFLNQDTAYEKALQMANHPDYRFLLVYAPHVDQQLKADEILAETARSWQMFDRDALDRTPEI